MRQNAAKARNPGISIIKKEQRKKHGVTLIEVLLSSSIVILLIMGLAQLTLHSLYVKRIADYRLRSAELAASKLEYLKSFPFDSTELAEGTKEESIHVKGHQGHYRRVWTIEDVSLDMKKIEMECTFEDYPKRKMRLVLYLSRELGF